MRSIVVLTAAVALLCLGGIAKAVGIETVAVGDPGNAADTRYDNPGYGSVSYTYSIGKYEVTAAQYCEFLNQKAKSDPYGLWNPYMEVGDHPFGCNIQRSGSDGNYAYSVATNYANRPVNYVSYWDACRFVNWLHNGQGGGDTETGAYTLDGYNGTAGSCFVRNAGARWFLPNEDEWYKAAYYKGRGINAGYWDYPTQSDSVNTGMANYSWSVGHPTDVGSYAYPGAYGTFDQGGNILEWMSVVGQNPMLRCGDWNNSTIDIRNRFYDQPGGGDDGGWAGSIGFRVAGVPPVPEPSSLLALLCGLGGLGGIAWRRRDASGQTASRRI